MRRHQAFALAPVCDVACDMACDVACVVPGPWRAEGARRERRKMEKAALDTCGFCGERSAAKLKQCSKCRRAHFCDKECMLAGWPAHKKQCAEWCASAA